MDNEKNDMIDNSLKKFLGENVRSDFDPFFPDRLMHRIKSLPDSKNGFEILAESLSIQFRKFALSAVMIIILIISYNLISAGELTLEKALDIPDVSFEEALNPLNNLAWSN